MVFATKSRPAYAYAGDGELVRDSPAVSRTVRTVTLLALLGVVLVFATAAAYQLGWLEPETHNRLILGSESSVASEYRRRPKFAKELDGKTAEQILDMRRQEVARHQELIGDDYVPSAAIVKNLNRSDRWVGTLGKFGYEESSKITEGPSNASRIILNPLLLVAAEVWPVDPLMKRLQLSPERFGPSTFYRYQRGEIELPFVCKPENIVWHPQSHRGSVTYDVGSFLSSRAAADRKRVVLSTMAEVDFNLLNARDLGYKYCYTSGKFLKNVEIVEIGRTGTKQPLKLADGIDASQSDASGPLLDVHSSYPQGKFLLTGEFPASAKFLLWQRSPEIGSPPDVQFTVIFTNGLPISPAARQWVNYFRASHDALCVAGLALAEIAKDPEHAEVPKLRAMLASQRLEELGKAQRSLPALNRKIDGEVKRYVSGKELKKGYSLFSRVSGIVEQLDSLPGYERLVAEYHKPHWTALRGLK